MKMKRKLKKIGKILHYSPIAPNILIIKTREYLSPGTVVFDSNLREIGVVIETFGPVESPYARVKVNSNDNQTKYTPNDDVFVITGEKARVKWRKMPRNGIKRR